MYSVQDKEVVKAHVSHNFVKLFYSELEQMEPVSSKRGISGSSKLFIQQIIISTLQAPFFWLAVSQSGCKLTSSKWFGTEVRAL